MDEFQRLGLLGPALFQKGDYRGSADAYLAACRVNEDRWHFMRWQVYHGFTSILCEKYFPPTEDHLAFLREIKDDLSEVSAFRAEACFALGLLNWGNMERVEAAALYREGLDIQEKESEKGKEFCFVDGGGTVMNHGTGELLTKIHGRCKYNLDRMVNRNTCGPMPQSRRSDGSLQEDEVKKLRLPIGAGGTALSETDLEKLISVGGDTCDACGAILETTTLKKCLVCNKAFYCSSECAAKQQEAGHSKFCKKPGQHDAGDRVLLRGIKAKPELNGMIVRIVGPATPGRMAVSIEGGTTQISVSTEKIVQVRPLV